MVKTSWGLEGLLRTNEKLYDSYDFHNWHIDTYPQEIQNKTNRFKIEQSLEELWSKQVEI